MVVFAANARRAPPHAVGRGSSSPTPRQVGGCGFETSWPSPLTPVPRGPRALRPVENRPTAHGARARWRTWRGCLRGQRATRSTPRRWPRLFFTDTAPGRRLRLRNVVANRLTPVARDPRALRPVENRPTAHGARARWRTWRGCLRGQRATRSTPRRWPRLFFTDTAPGRRLQLRISWPPFDSRGARPARASPRGEPADRPRSTRALADLAWLSSRPTRDALHPTPLAEALLHRHRARSAAAASERLAKLSTPVPRGPRALRPVENRPTAHGARRAGGLGVVVFAANARRAPPHAVGRGSSSPTPRQVGGCGFETSWPPRLTPVAARPARASPRGEPADRPRSTRALADLAWLSSRLTRDALHPTPLAEALLHRHRARSAAASSNLMDTVLTPVARGPRALRPVENRPTAHGARARWRTWRGCLRGQRATRSTPRRWPRLFFTDTAPGRRLRLRTSWPSLSTPVPRGPRALRPVENRPTAHGARARWRTWRGCLRGQRATRSTPRRWPRLFFTDTAPGRRLRLRNVVATAFDSRGARPARASPRGEPADRPRSTRALADLAWLSSRPTRDALHPTPLAEALLHRHRARSAAAASKARGHRFDSRAARPARASPRGEPADRPRSTRCAGGLGVVVFAANARRAPPHAVGRGSSSPTPRQVGGCGFETSWPLRLTSVARGPRALRPVENRPTAHGARARWRTWRGCLRGQRGTRSTPRRWPRLLFADTAPGRRLRLRNVVTTL